MPTETGEHYYHDKRPHESYFDIPNSPTTVRSIFSSQVPDMWYLAFPVESNTSPRRHRSINTYAADYTISSPAMCL